MASSRINVKGLVTFVVLCTGIGRSTAGTSTAHYHSLDKLLERVFSLRGQLLSCVFHEDSTAIQDALQRIPKKNQFIVDEQALQGLVATCLFQHEQSPEHDRKRRDVQAIYPGTKWCGAGNIADNYDDLGPERETDICCRTHDHCGYSIPAGETRDGLTNEEDYTISACSCDEEFYNCLKGVNSFSSNAVGVFFFNTVRVKCVKVDYPQICQGRWLWKTCVPDTSKPKQLIFAEPKLYI